MQSNNKTKKQLEVELQAALQQIENQQFHIELLKEIKGSLEESVLILSGLKPNPYKENREK